MVVVTPAESIVRYLRWLVAGLVCGVVIQLLARWAGYPDAGFLASWAIMLLGTGFAVSLLLGLNMGVPQTSILAGRDDPPPFQSTSGAVRVMLFSACPSSSWGPTPRTDTRGSAGRRSRPLDR